MRCEMRAVNEVMKTKTTRNGSLKFFPLLAQNLSSHFYLRENQRGLNYFSPTNLVLANFSLIFCYILDLSELLLKK